MSGSLGRTAGRLPAVSPDDSALSSETLSAVPLRAAARRRLSLSAGVVLVIGLLVYTWVWYRNAFLIDDAYITFRPIEQLLAGNGLRFNVHERVQPFTHPLWMLLLVPLRVAGLELPTAAMMLSLLSSLGFLLILYLAADRDAARWFVALAIVTVSRTLLDWSSSGLETPLTALLVSAFSVRVLRNEPDDRHWSHGTLTATGLLLSAIVLTRHDLVLLVGPATFAVARRRSVVVGWRRTAGEVVLGSLPLLGWSLFSIAYYGSPVPNTALAKLFAGIPRRVLVEMGIDYLRVSATWDPLVLPVLAAAAWLMLRRSRSELGRWLGLGVGLHLIYLVVAGGDFMAGRFLVPEAAIAVTVLTLRAPRTAWVAGALPAVVLIGLLWPRSPLRMSEDYRPAWRWGDADKGGIQDAKGFFTDWLTQGLRHGWLPAASFPQHAPCVVTALGRIGYHAALSQILVDSAALADPFLARLGSEPPWKAGHFLRRPPPGYLDSLAAHRNELADPELRQLYEDVRRLVSAPLTDFGRWKAAWRLLRRPLPRADIHRCPRLALHPGDLGEARELPVAFSFRRASSTQIVLTGVLPLGEHAADWELRLRSEQPISEASLRCRPADRDAPVGFELHLTSAVAASDLQTETVDLKLSVARSARPPEAEAPLCLELPEFAHVRDGFPAEVADRR